MGMCQIKITWRSTLLNFGEIGSEIWKARVKNSFMPLSNVRRNHGVYLDEADVSSTILS